MALSKDANYIQRGSTPMRNVFGYVPAAGAVIYRGALVGLTAAGAIQPIQASGTVVFAGMADRASNTVAQPEVAPFVQGMKGTWQLVVPSATYANIGAPVYATDDNTLTLSSNSGANLQVGTLAGIDINGITYVNLAGS